MRALIIGADGFAGRWLTRHLVESGDTVVAGVGPRFSGHLPLAEEVLKADVRSLEAVRDLVGVARPEVSYYLAGVAQRGGREALAASAEVSVTGSLHALLGLSEDARGTRLLFVSSGFVYPSSPAAQGEDSVCEPADTYGATKLAAEGILQQLAERGGIELDRCSPLQPHRARTKARIPRPNHRKATARGRRRADGPDHGRHDYRPEGLQRRARRGSRLPADWQRPDRPGATYNVASGRARVVSEVIDLMIEIAGVRAEVVSQTPPGPSGPEALVGDASALRSLGWSPAFTLEESLRDVLVEYMPEGWQSPALRPTAR